MPSATLCGGAECVAAPLFGAQTCKRGCGALKHNHETSIVWQMPPEPAKINMFPGILGEIWGCFPAAIEVYLAFTGLGCSQRPESWTRVEDAPKANRRKKMLYLG